MPTGFFFQLDKKYSMGTNWLEFNWAFSGWWSGFCWPFHLFWFLGLTLCINWAAVRPAKPKSCTRRKSKKPLKSWWRKNWEWIPPSAKAFRRCCHVIMVKGWIRVNGNARWLGNRRHLAFGKTSGFYWQVLFWTAGKWLTDWLSQEAGVMWCPEMLDVPKCLDIPFSNSLNKRRTLQTCSFHVISIKHFSPVPSISPDDVFRMFFVIVDSIANAVLPFSLNRPV